MFAVEIVDEMVKKQFARWWFICFFFIHLVIDTKNVDTCFHVRMTSEIFDLAIFGFSSSQVDTVYLKMSKSIQL
jgi:hypothetical protein